MALIHYQFEAIHPFSDGNGRTGRILNILYLIQQELLGLPVLYLSHYIIQKKPDYYRLIKSITEENNWEEWVLFVVNGVATTAEMTLQKIKDILELKINTEINAKEVLKSSYSKELVDLLFRVSSDSLNSLFTVGFKRFQMLFNARLFASLCKFSVFRNSFFGNKIKFPQSGKHCI